MRRADSQLLEALDEELNLVTTTDRYPHIYNAWLGVRERSVPGQVLIAWLSWVLVPLPALAISWNASLLLGLATTLGFVRGHRGALEVESAPREGTVVRVLFPVSTTLLRVREAIA